MIDTGRSAPPSRALDDDVADVGPHRLSTWFSVTGLLLLATVLAAAFVQVRQHALLNQTVRYQDDYLVLSLYQVQIEYLRLREEHRDLDAVIEALIAGGSVDQLQLQRLKKRKLVLRDRIAFLEDQLTPDIIA